MNDLASPVRSRDRTEQVILHAVVDPGARISPFDRLSLRLGLWLLLRSTRRLQRTRNHADHARLLAHLIAREERERLHLRARLDRRQHL